MKQTFNVLFFVRRTKLKKTGDTPIMLRITIEGQLVEMQLKRDVKPNLWNQNKERCTGKDAASLEINRYLESVKLRLFEIHRKMEEEGKLINPMEIKRKFLGLDEEHKMFFKVFQEHNDKCRELIGKDYAKVTISRFDTCLKYFKEMVLNQYRVKDIPLREVNHALIQDYIHFLKVEKNLSENTLIRYMKVIKKITNMALANEWMTKNPFVNIKFHEQEVHKEFLTKEELEILRTKEFDIPRLDLVRDVFLFQCWTGLAFIDVSELKEEHIVSDNEGNLWIRKSRQKTKIMCNIPLLDIPLQILEKYKDHPLCQKKGVLLPVMSNQKVNSYLKEIADFCGIKKQISSHSGRHTFSTVVALANNVSLENVAKMLGHTNTKMTQRYAKVLDQSILRDMQGVRENFAK
ncbi:site-specific recombinase XerD [Parabacteroides sp. PF5-5]|uniref:site-specific integrase n=1 Tax=unclassified Parabacteroides TaxID=2649774 RepID=UPI002473D424|nr:MULTISPECIES: site-specific integrase [unclassified Parabacteroides]MDH6306703.1 site-specific recombinase XerD [Parabacteroides sp. PH5-39]MDH6316194.1 site-specific recombinase XerD [Parabacteroides sp. PF5-13]MDH6321445.1 site-specific recombinase XerD [Parabacteroides sp. PH5-13]MDH6325176.1 site-specific recombinase XerD [Parabacteroides sp. PH5-8]MDH6327385.1 site-specific recombinase XerD [Parabacteroides sp. PH5-41]